MLMITLEVGAWWFMLMEHFTFTGNETRVEEWTPGYPLQAFIFWSSIFRKIL